MDEIVYYNIAGIPIKVTSDLDFPLEYGDVMDFRTSQTDFDYEICFKQISNINDYISSSLECVYQTPWCHFYLNKENNIEYRFFVDNNFYYAVSIIKDNKIDVYYIASEWMLKIISKGNLLYNYMCIDYILMSQNKFLLHSCHISYDNQSILFTAPSGTGKSTQGNLWKQYKGAKVINGDRTAIGKIDNQWIAFGIPMAGSSGIHLNESYLLNCIVIIRQAKEDRVKKLSSFETYKYLYNELSVYNWNKDFVSNSLTFIEELIKDIPIYLFECTKEESAVNTLYNFFKEEGIL